MRRRGRRLAYEPLGDPPYIPADKIERRIAPYIAAPDENGCRMWTGSKRRQDGVLRICAPIGSVTIAAHKLAWVAAGNDWVEMPAIIRRTCKNSFCCEVSHMVVVPSDKVRSLTDAQVREAREEYWSNGRRPRLEGGRLHVSNAEQHTAWDLGMARGTVQRVLAGKRTMPHIWNSAGVDEQRVREVFQTKVRLVDELREKQHRTLSQEDLAARYGVSVNTMSRAVRGESYKHLPMPKCAKNRR